MPKRKPAAKPSVQRVHSRGTVAWLNMTRPNASTLKELKKLYPFLLDEDLQDCLPPYERPKLLVRDEYAFLVMLFPVLDEATGTIVPYEVDFFIGKDFLVTSHLGTHPTVATLAAACDGDGKTCPIRFDDTPLRVTLEVVHGLVVASYPMVTEMSNQIIGMERNLFDDDEEGTATRRLLRLRTNIVVFRKAIQGSDNALLKLMVRGDKVFPVEAMRATVDDIINHTREIREFLDNDRDTIDALYDAHLSLVTFKTNQATKTLTAMAFIIFPMTLVAAVFSMRAEHMPFLGHRGDFWIMLSVMFGVMLATVLYIRSRKWL